MGNVKIIAASAGSGKTYRLAYEYVKSVVENPSFYRNILAVTFTNKATEEMSSRILERLHELATEGVRSPYLDDLCTDLNTDEATIRTRAKEARHNILHDYSRFAVLTIDRFFQRLIRSFLRELGVDGGFELRLETDELLALAADALIDEASADTSIRDRLFAASTFRLDEGRRWDIREGLVALGGELFGEEYRRGAENAPDPSIIEQIVERSTRACDAMQSKAAGALKIIAGAALTADDFKGRNTRSLVTWLRKVATGDFIPLSPATAEAAASDDLSAWAPKTSPSRAAVESLIPTLQPLLRELENIHAANRRLVASARLLGENSHNFVLLGDLQRHIERICREENIVPISETNRMIARLVGGNDTPFIFERAGSYFTRFLVDEFQDTSQAQWENFVPLLRNAIAGEPGHPVLLIGDVKQAIYRWRGSDWRILSRRVHEQMGQGRVESETLATNYRSLRRIVEFTGEAVGRMTGAAGAALDATVASALREGSLPSAEADELTGMLAAAYAGHTQTPRPEADGGYVTMTVYGPDAEGKYAPPIVARVEELQSRGYRAGDIAILVRSNTQGARVAQMLLDHKRLNPGSPYRYDVVTAEALTVGASAASRFIIACLSLAAEPSDTIQRAVFNRWLGRPFDSPLTADDAEFFARLAALSPGEAFEETVLRFGLDRRTDDIAYIQAVHGQIVSFSSRSVADIPLFLKWWNEHGAAASITMQQSADAITVSTIHKSKGLEYPAVIVPWLSWSLAPEVRGRPLVLWSESAEGGLAGAVPINYKEAMGGSWFSARYYREQVLAAIDSMNLFYVAATRAGRELHLMASDKPRESRGTVGGLLREVMNVTAGFTEWGAPECLPGSGSAAHAQALSGALRTYPTRRPGARVRLRLPVTRYAEDGVEGPDLSPRDLGVLMHRALEGAVTAADIALALDRMAADALVSPAEHARLRDNIDRALADPRVAEWFDGEWDEVRNEAGIVIPGAPATRRPDRVMIRGTKAVIVDYKFGRRTPPEHAAQLRGYTRLLREMGYTDTEAYLWYVALDRIEKVS
ncbi:MAG: UvrD-helicase domain-containing protein [Alistipes sp.]|jgi:ATP-dependent exoDNAse (exonuclease V) beta subunit|nr:UvrD-helicase domain-containing protein [Alistipes sp.]